MYTITLIGVNPALHGFSNSQFHGRCHAGFQSAQCAVPHGLPPSDAQPKSSDETERPTGGNTMGYPPVNQLFANWKPTSPCFMIFAEQKNGDFPVRYVNIAGTKVGGCFFLLFHTWELMDFDGNWGKLIWGQPRR